MRTLVLGGARSGKSAWAERQLLISHTGETLGYIATARPWPDDVDFADRVAEHQRRRQAQAASTGTRWVTLDEQDATYILSTNPSDQVSLPAAAEGFQGSFLLDDVGTWLTHILDSDHLWEAGRGECEPFTDALVNSVAEFPTTFGEAADLFIISPEVGLSVIPPTHAGRLFRDQLGTLNQRLAAVCERVVLVVAGCPLVIKS